MKLVSNQDRIYSKKRSSREVFESLAYRVIHEFDEGYFHGAAHVTGVKLAHFVNDYRDGGSITFGCFNSETNIIYLNRHVKDLVDLGLSLNEFHAILWHELCHAVLINAHQQLRNGQYAPCGGDHGDDFERLLHSHPVMAQVLDNGVIERLAERIAVRMRMEGEKAWKTRPN